MQFVSFFVFSKLVVCGTHTSSLADHKDVLRDSATIAVTDSADVQQACKAFLECGLLAIVHTGWLAVVAGDGDSTQHAGMPIPR